MTKKTLKMTAKVDFITEDQDFLDGFDSMTDEEFCQLLNEICENLDVKYAGVYFKIRDAKGKKLKK